MKNLIFAVLVLTGVLTMTDTNAQVYVPGKNQIVLMGQGPNNDLAIYVNNILIHRVKRDTTGSAQLPLDILSHPGKNTVRIESKEPYSVKVYNTPMDSFPDEGKLLGEASSSSTLEYTLQAHELPVFDWFSGQDITEADCAAAKAKATEIFAMLQKKDKAAFAKIQLQCVANSNKLMPPEYVQNILAEAQQAEAATEDGWVMPTDIECRISDSKKIISLNASDKDWLFSNGEENGPSFWGLKMNFYKNAAGEIVPAMQLP